MRWKLSLGINLLWIETKKKNVAKNDNRNFTMLSLHATFFSVAHIRWSHSDSAVVFLIHLYGIKWKEKTKKKATKKPAWITRTKYRPKCKYLISQSYTSTSRCWFQILRTSNDRFMVYIVQFYLLYDFCFFLPFLWAVLSYFFFYFTFFEFGKTKQHCLFQFYAYILAAGSISTTICIFECLALTFLYILLFSHSNVFLFFIISFSCLRHVSISNFRASHLSTHETNGEIKEATVKLHCHDKSKKRKKKRKIVKYGMQLNENEHRRQGSETHLWSRKSLCACIDLMPSQTKVIKIARHTRVKQSSMNNLSIIIDRKK